MLLSSLLGINFEFDHINLGKISISLSTIDFLLKKFITICIIVMFMTLVINIGNRLIDKAVQKQLDTNFKFSYLFFQFLVFRINFQEKFKPDLKRHLVTLQTIFARQFR